MSRKWTFQGVEFDIIDEDDINKALASGETTVYSVIRVRDTDPLGGSPQLRKRRTIIYCDACRQACYLDPLSYQEVAILNPVILCLQCTADRVEREKP